MGGAADANAAQRRWVDAQNQRCHELEKYYNTQNRPLCDPFVANLPEHLDTFMAAGKMHCLAGRVDPGKRARDYAREDQTFVGERASKRNGSFVFRQDFANRGAVMKVSRPKQKSPASD